MSYRAIQSFDHTTSQVSYEQESMSSSNTYLYISRSEDDNSVDDILETLSNYHPLLIKDFLSHHPMRSHRIFSPLIRSDRFFIDQSQPLCILHYVQNIPHKHQRVKLGNKPKYRFIYTRYYGDLRCKDHLHYSQQRTTI